MAGEGGGIGRYLAIGLNRIDPDAYGTPGTLTACEHDAQDMAALATRAGFSGTTLLSEAATSSAVLAHLTDAAESLRSGDVLVVSYSGLGGRIGNVVGSEDNALVDTWCLYDRQLMVNELHALWARFQAGVRIVVFSDSCHGGVVAKALMRTLHARAQQRQAAKGPESPPLLSVVADPADDGIDACAGVGVVKALPLALTWNLYLRDKAMYDGLQRIAGADELAALAVRASVLVLSGCQDDQLSRDGTRNGAFTLAVKTTWSDGAFQGNYKDFHLAIAANRSLRSDQTPNYAVVGVRDPVFEAQRPLTI